MPRIKKVKANNKQGYAYEFVMDLPPDPRTGKRRQTRRRGFLRKQDAEDEITEIRKSIKDGTFVKETDILFKDHANDWLAEYDQKPTTVKIRKYELRLLLDYLGNRKVKDITRRIYRDALNNLKEKGYSHSTLIGVNSTGRMIFRKAMEDEVIRKNPTDYVTVSKPKKTVKDIEEQNKIPKYLEKNELAHFLTTAKSEGLGLDYLIFKTLAYSGMRVGELCALKWKDIDFINCTFNITKTIYNSNESIKVYQLLTPKTEGSIRKIEMDKEVIDELSLHRARQNQFKMKNRKNYYDKDFVFAKQEGYIGYPEKVGRVWYRMKRLLKFSGLSQDLTTHSLRHTHTSLLAEAGVSLEEIMDRLGHVNDQTTRLVYLHVTQDKKKEAVHKFRDLMSKSVK